MPGSSRSGTGSLNKATRNGQDQKTVSGKASALSGEDKLQQECLDLKKHIYERWEQSIMSRNNFSPAIKKSDSGPNSLSAPATAKQGILKSKSGAAPKGLPKSVNGSDSMLLVSSSTGTSSSSLSNLAASLKAPTSPSLDPRLPSSDNIDSSPPATNNATTEQQPSLSLADQDSDASHGSVDKRALPSKSVKPGEDLTVDAGQKLEDVLTTASTAPSQASDSTSNYESEGVIAEVKTSGCEPEESTSQMETSSGTVPPPMPLYDFLNSKLPSPTSNGSDKQTSSYANTLEGNAKLTHHNEKSQPQPGRGSVSEGTGPHVINSGMQKPPSHPRPVNQSNRPVYAAAQPKQVKRVPTLPRPKTGINVPMIWPPPEHMRWVPAQPETLHVARDRLVASLMEHDSNRLLSNSKVLNRVVYDSIEAPPQSLLGGAKASKKKVDSSGKSLSDVAVSDIAAGTVSAGAAEAHAAHAAAPDVSPPGVFDSCLHGKSEDGKLKPYYMRTDQDDKTLIFESRFESGNLRRSIQVYENEYDLIVKPDINTRGHTQWFYFSVSNTRKGTPVKFNLINMYKSDSLYNRGMKPLMYSMIDASHLGEEAVGEKVGWRRCGTDICYYQNHIKRKGGHYYTASFTVTFPHDHDTVFLAYCYPYSYTDLQAYLKQLEDDPQRRNRFRRRTMCQTLAGNNCDLLTITSFACDPESLSARKGVVVSARVHPGESNSSYMMKGVIDYLTGPSLDAKILRDNFVFKIVPMLNPDGVIVGNYRCNLAGVDLNRTWDAPSRKLNPTIFYLKQMIRRFMDDRELILFCDLHGHSRKMNVFMYGCENKKSWSLRLRERVFPRMLWRNASIFSFADCSFKVSKQKENAGRVVVWRELGLTNSYTMEASFCGADFGRYANLHFSVAEFEEMGHYFCDTILDYCDPDQSKVASTLRELQALNPSSHTHADRVEAEDSDSGSDTETKPPVKQRRAKRRSNSNSSNSSSSGSSSSSVSSSSSNGASSSNSTSGRVVSGGGVVGNTTSGGSGYRKNISRRRSDSSRTDTSSKDGSSGGRRSGGGSKGGRSTSSSDKGSRRRKKNKERNRDGPLSVNEALAQADAALSKAVATRHLAGSGSAAVKARKSLR